MNVAAPNSAAAADAAKVDKPTVVIRKVKRSQHAPHHGGAWKVAYADFVTAMMAFFLLLWLLNATTEEQKRAISNYFAPESVSRSTSGSGGVLGGNVPADKDLPAPQTGVTGVLVPVPQAPGGQTTDSESGGETEDTPEAEIRPEEQEPAEAPPPAAVAGGPSDAEAAARQREEQRFAEAEAALRRALDETPSLHRLADSLLIDRTDEGLRIQLVDQDKLAMFPLGSAEMQAHTRELLKRMAKILQRMPNKIAITGHTDATPYSSPKGYGNWELSTDRANASRRMLMAEGIPGERFARVVGKADQEPMLPADPTNPRNRRISIVVLNEGDAAAGP